MDELSVRLVVDNLVRAWNERDLDRFIGFLDGSVVWNDPAMLYGPVKGHREVRNFCEALLNAFPDFTYQIREPICVSRLGERCVIPWEITATHLGYFDPPGFAPTNQTITMQGVDILELSNSKVIRIDTLFNVLPALEQVIALKPFPKRGLKKKAIVSLQRCRAYWLRRKMKGGRL
jgi:hypothetical protein